MNADSTSAPALRGPWPGLARVAWLAVASVSVSLLILLIPINLRGIYFDWQFRLTYPVVAPYLSRSTYAAYVLTGGYLLALVILITAGLIAWRKADDRMAWLTASVLVMTPVIFNLGGYSETWSYYPHPWSDIFRWTRETMAWLGGALGLSLFIFLFPNGRFAPRWMAWAYGLAMLLITLLVAWLFLGGDNIYGYWLVTFLGTLFLGLAGQIYRYRRISTPLERQQTKWVVISITLWVTSLALFTLVQAVVEGTPYAGLALLLANHLGWLASAFVPLTLAFSIFRYRLWDIDLLIRRTLIYSALTGALALAYFSSVIALQGLFRALTGQGQSPLVTVLSTLAIAALFAPLRRRVQDAIDRRFYRKKYDAAKTLAAFAATCRDETDLDKLTASLINVVQETMQPAHLSLWLRKDIGASRRAMPPEGKAKP